MTDSCTTPGLFNEWPDYIEPPKQRNFWEGIDSAIKPDINVEKSMKNFI